MAKKQEPRLRGCGGVAPGRPPPALLPLRYPAAPKPQTYSSRKGFKKGERARTGETDPPLSTPGGGPGAEAWRVAGCGDKPAPLGTARGSHGNCRTSPRGRSSKTAWVSWCLPRYGTAPYKRNKHHRRAAASVGTEAATERSCKCHCSVTVRATRGSKWQLIPSVPVSLDLPSWSWRQPEAATPWSGYKVLTGRYPIFCPREWTTKPPRLTQDS